MAWASDLMATVLLIGDLMMTVRPTGDLMATVLLTCDLMVTVRPTGNLMMTCSADRRFNNDLFCLQVI